MKVLQIFVNETTHYYNVDNGTWDDENKYCACANPEDFYSVNDTNGTDYSHAIQDARDRGFAPYLIDKIELVELPEIE